MPRGQQEKNKNQLINLNQVLDLEAAHGFGAPGAYDFAKLIPMGLGKLLGAGIENQIFLYASVISLPFYAIDQMSVYGVNKRVSKEMRHLLKVELSLFLQLILKHMPEVQSRIMKTMSKGLLKQVFNSMFSKDQEALEEKIERHMESIQAYQTDILEIICGLHSIIGTETESEQSPITLLNYTRLHDRFAYLKDVKTIAELDAAVLKIIAENDDYADLRGDDTTKRDKCFKSINIDSENLKKDQKKIIMENLKFMQTIFTQYFDAVSQHRQLFAEKHEFELNHDEFDQLRDHAFSIFTDIGWVQKAVMIAQYEAQIIYPRHRAELAHGLRERIDSANKKYEGPSDEFKWVLEQHMSIDNVEHLYDYFFNNTPEDISRQAAAKNKTFYHYILEQLLEANKDNGARWDYSKHNEIPPIPRMLDKQKAALFTRKMTQMAQAEYMITEPLSIEEYNKQQQDSFFQVLTTVYKYLQQFSLAIPRANKNFKYLLDIIGDYASMVERHLQTGNTMLEVVLERFAEVIDEEKLHLDYNAIALKSNGKVTDPKTAKEFFVRELTQQQVYVDYIKPNSADDYYQTHYINNMKRFYEKLQLFGIAIDEFENHPDEAFEKLYQVMLERAKDMPIHEQIVPAFVEVIVEKCIPLDFSLLNDVNLSDDLAAMVSEIYVRDIANFTLKSGGVPEYVTMASLLSEYKQIWSGYNNFFDFMPDYTIREKRTIAEREADLKPAQAAGPALGENVSKALILRVQQSQAIVASGPAPKKEKVISVQQQQHTFEVSELEETCKREYFPNYNELYFGRSLGTVLSDEDDQDRKRKKTAAVEHCNTLLNSHGHEWNFEQHLGFYHVAIQLINTHGSGIKDNFFGVSDTGKWKPIKESIIKSAFAALIRQAEDYKNQGLREYERSLLNFAIDSGMFDKHRLKQAIRKRLAKCPIIENVDEDAKPSVKAGIL